jgi:hypothetical protein
MEKVADAPYHFGVELTGEKALLIVVAGGATLLYRPTSVLPEGFNRKKMSRSRSTSASNRSTQANCWS